jgi:hypothetical protein
MGHQTGPDGPAGTEEAEQAAAVDFGGPESGSASDGAVDFGGPESASAGDGAADFGRPESASAGDGAVDFGAPATESAAEQPPERARELQPVPTTGEPRVDAALKLLDRLPGLPVSEHSEVFEQVHAQLSDVLGELDSWPALPAGG